MKEVIWPMLDALATIRRAVNDSEPATSSGSGNSGTHRIRRTA